jgi:ABC-type antimicrobial peptide transport system permease subunit
MKIVGILGILVTLFGGLLLIIGLIVCVNTWTSDYATSACAKAEEDKKAFADAREMCGSTTSDCYKQATIGLTSEEDCEHNKEFMNRQMLMGIVPAVIGVILGGVGLIMAVGGFVLARKKAAAAS